MNKMIEITHYSGEGYKPLVSFGEWRVAVLRHLDELEPENLNRMERHMETDEVFILVGGSCILLVGGDAEKPENIAAYDMKVGDFYNVKKAVWHTSSLSRDAHVIIVENDDTRESNSENFFLTSELKNIVQGLAGKMLNDPKFR